MTESNATETVVPMHGMDETRHRVRRQIEELRANDKRYSDSHCARAMGVSPSAFSQWMKGTYKGDNAQIEHKALTWLRSLEERRLHDQELPQAPEFIDTPTSRRIWNTLVYAQAACDLVVVYGEAGVGKSETGRHYQTQHPNVHIATMTPATSGAGSALNDIADELGLAGNTTQPYQVQREIIKYLRGREGLLIIDEAQQLNLQGLEMIRSLHDLAGIGVAVVGNPSVYARMTGGTRASSYAQVFGRIGKRCRITGSTADDATAIGSAWGVKGKDELTTLHQIARKPGGVRVVTKTLRMASLIARQRKQEIDEETIRQAYADLVGGGLS